MKGKGWRNSTISSPPSGRSLKSPQAPLPRMLKRDPTAIAGFFSEERTTRPSDKRGVREDAEGNGHRWDNGERSVEFRARWLGFQDQTTTTAQPIPLSPKWRGSEFYGTSLCNERNIMLTTIQKTLPPTTTPPTLPTPTPHSRIRNRRAKSRRDVVREDQGCVVKLLLQVLL
jgi:hypothetical protein